MRFTRLTALLVALAPAPAFADPAGNEAVARSAVEQVLGGGRFEIIGRLFVRFRNGRIVEEWSVLDNLALLRQFDLLPAPPRAS